NRVPPATVALLRECNMAVVAEQSRPQPSRWRRWSTRLLETGKVFLDPDTSLRCAGTAFFAFLSLFPAVAIVVLIYGLVADRTSLVETVQTLAFILPQSAAELVT